MTKRLPHDDLLSQIPSPSRRLWVGLCVILSIFVIFSIYAIYEIRWLEDFQANVVQQNRKASLQLLRLQNDAYLLAISIRDLEHGGSRYGISGSRAEFARLQEDMSHAREQESRYAVHSPAADDKRSQLAMALEDFWRTSDEVFALAARGQDAQARNLVESELDAKREVISEIVARLLVLNDQAQAEAGEKIGEVYSRVKRDILVLIVVLFLLALGTGLYTFEANRKTFRRLHHLAERLQAQSEQLRRLSWKLIVVQEDTLRQVARDLHDEFGQILTAIGTMLNRAAQRGLDKNSSFWEEVRAVQKIIADTLQNVRDSSQIFRPAILDDFGLEQTLEWFTRQFGRQTGIEVHFAGELSDGLVPAESAIHIYRILQEALSNVARHSGVTEAWVNLGEANGELRLEIRDNGKGFETGGEMDRWAGEGIGLMGMRERASHLNGSLDIQSAPGRGTVVTLRMPLERSRLNPAAERVNT